MELTSSLSFLLTHSCIGLQEVLFVLLTLVCLHLDALSEKRSDIYRWGVSQVSSI